MLSILNRFCNRTNFIPFPNVCSLVIVLIIAVFFTSACSKQDEKILATVGDYDITQNVFENRYSEYIVASGVKDTMPARKAILTNMINEILLKHYDNNKEIYQSDEYQKEKEWLFKKVLIDFLKDKEFYGDIEVTDKEIREAFAKMNQTLTAHQLNVQTAEEANRLYKLIQAGASFELLKKQVFTDSDLENNNDYLTTFTWGDIGATFEKTAYSLDVGEISKPVKTANGYSIIKLESKEYNPTLAEYQYQQNKYHILKTIKRRKKKTSESKLIKSLFDVEKLKIDDNAVKDILKVLTTAGFNSNIDKQYHSKVVAWYEDETYLTGDILRKIGNMPEFRRRKISSQDSVKSVVNELVEQDVLLDEAEGRGYDKSEAMFKNYKTMLNNLFLTYKKKQIAQNASVDDSTLLNYYNNHIQLFSTNDEINIQEIIVEDKKLAAELTQKIKNNEDFGKLATKYSIREWSAKNKGEIGFTSLNNFGELKSTFWNASVGDLIGPREISGYYCLFKVLGKKKSKPIEFGSIRSEVLKVFREDRQPKLLLKHINQISSNIKIAVNDDLLGSQNVSLLN